MSDRLEQFIRDHKEALDHLKAPEGVWDRVAPIRKAVFPIWKYTAIAASGLLLIAMGYILGMRTQQAPMDESYSELKEAEQYYQSRINQKMEQIKTLPVHDEVISDLQVLDEVYEQLRKEMAQDPNTKPERLLSAMVRHQQQKLDIMEKILERVDKYQNNENHKREM